MYIDTHSYYRPTRTVSAYRACTHAYMLTHAYTLTHVRTGTLKHTHKRTQTRPNTLTYTSKLCKYVYL